MRNHLKKKREFKQENLKRIKKLKKLKTGTKFIKMRGLTMPSGCKMV